MLCGLTSFFSKRRMQFGTTRSPGKSIILLLPLYKREAGDTREAAGGSCAGQEHGCGLKRSRFRVTGSLSGTVNQDFFDWAACIEQNKVDWNVLSRCESPWKKTSRWGLGGRPLI